jgi:hypothetical protein
MMHGMSSRTQLLRPEHSCSEKFSTEPDPPSGPAVEEEAEAVRDPPGRGPVESFTDFIDWIG